MTYYYQVSAYNAVGEGPRSIVASATTDSDAPTAPSGITASALSSSNISVSWDWVSGADGYTVYRSTSSSGTYSYVGGTYDTYYTDTYGLSPGTTYYYRVSAYNNSYGEGSQSSSYGAATTYGGSIGGPGTTGVPSASPYVMASLYPSGSSSDPSNL
jgi:fibronectin type 3 domain-containing protein